MQTPSEFKTNRFNVKEVTNPRVTGGRIKDKIKLSASDSERRAVVADISANSVALQSGGDTVLVAPRIKAEHMSVEADSASSYDQIAKATGATYFELPGISWEQADIQLGTKKCGISTRNS